MVATILVTRTTCVRILLDTICSHSLANLSSIQSTNHDHHLLSLFINNTSHNCTFLANISNALSLGDFLDIFSFFAME